MNTFRFPFDWRYPFGYIIAIVSQILVLYLNCATFICSWMLFVGMCMFIASFVANIRVSFENLNAAIALARLNGSRKKILELQANLNQIASFHSSVIQLSCHLITLLSMLDNFSFRFTHDFVDIFDKIILMNLAFGVISICTTLFQLYVVSTFTVYSILIHCSLSIKTIL